jgi:hypothetical protein
MKVQEHTIAAEKHVSPLEVELFMLAVNLDSLKRNISVSTWFEIHEMEKNGLIRLIWIKR